MYGESCSPDTPRTGLKRKNKNEPKCDNCRNHGVERKFREHKFKCEYRDCLCEACQSTKLRRIVNRSQQQRRRHNTHLIRHSQESEGEEFVAEAVAASTPTLAKEYPAKNYRPVSELLFEFCDRRLDNVLELLAHVEKEFHPSSGSLNQQQVKQESGETTTHPEPSAPWGGNPDPGYPNLHDNQRRPAPKSYPMTVDSAPQVPRPIAMATMTSRSYSPNVDASQLEYRSRMRGMYAAGNHGNHGNQGGYPFQTPAFPSTIYGGIPDTVNPWLGSQVGYAGMAPISQAARGVMVPHVEDQRMINQQEDDQEMSSQEAHVAKQ